MSVGEKVPAGDVPDEARFRRPMAIVRDFADVIDVFAAEFEHHWRQREDLKIHITQSRPGFGLVAELIDEYIVSREPAPVI